MNTGLYLTLRYALTVCALLACWAGSVDRADAAGPVGYRDCALSWNPNPEADLAGYRVYLGRNPDQLTRMRDVGLRTAFRCSEGDAAENGQWFGTVTAYDHSGNESDPAQAVPFEIAGWPDPVQPAQPVPPTPILEPSAAHLTGSEQDVTLSWDDLNSPQASHRVEVSSSLNPAWTTAAVQPPGVRSFSYFHRAGSAWACYRVRAEQGALASDWAQAGGPADRQFCLKPAELPALDQPILAPTILYEPEAVRLTVWHRGFNLSWGRPGAIVGGPTYRIEVSGSLNTRWTTLVILPPGWSSFGYFNQIDAEWVCLRIRAEVGRIISLWAAAGGPNDRQFCFKPSSALANTPP